MDTSEFTTDFVNIGRLSDIPPTTPIVRPFYTIQFNENNRILEVDLPGVEKDDIDIEVKEGILHIVGNRYEDDGVNAKESADDKKQSGKGNATKKKLVVQFQLRLQLGSVSVEIKTTFKSYKNGVLVLALPKKKIVEVHKVAIE